MPRRRPPVFHRQDLNTADLAAATNTSVVTAARVCAANPGFAYKFGGDWRVPPEHLERLKRGETAAEIAASVRAKASTSAEA